MTSEQWTALLKATEGHTPGPWVCIMSRGEISEVPDSRLASYAPDLLEEVKRLREWLDSIERSTTRQSCFGIGVLCRKALSGAEVPK